MDIPSTIESLSQSNRLLKRLIVFIVVLLAIGVLAMLGWRAAVLNKFERARVEWKDKALSRLASMSLTNKQIADELMRLKTARGESDWQEWTAQNVLLMTNGHYLVYEFRHGFNNGALDHLFLARSSDGRWFYSTYHFCNQMVGIIGDEPPGSIDDFADTYSAREFDGKSDECLQHTWPEEE